MANPTGLTFYIFCFLLLLLIPLTNSMKGGDPSMDPQSSSTGVKPAGKAIKSEKRTQQETTDNKLKKPVTQEELAEVDGDISALYIIRVIQERAEVLKTDTMANIPDGNETREIYAEICKDSNLPVSEIENLASGLVNALKWTTNKNGYLRTVNGHIEKFQTKRVEPEPLSSQVHKFEGLGTKLVNTFLFRRQKAEQHTQLVEKCKKLRQEHLDFLKQIQLEVELHYTIKSKDLEEFYDIDTILKKNAKHMEFRNLMKLNEETEKVYLDIATVLKSPQKKNKENFVTSILETAEKATAEGDVTMYAVAGNLLGRTYLRTIFNIASAVAKFRELPGLWRKTLYEEIGEKLEMPMGWLERMQAQASPKPKQGDDQLPMTEKMLSAQVEIVMAKTLLFYERLNKFYKIDYHYKMWKEKRLLLKDSLKSYFDKFEKEKKDEQAVMAASPPDNHHNNV